MKKLNDKSWSWQTREGIKPLPPLPPPHLPLLPVSLKSGSSFKKNKLTYLIKKILEREIKCFKNHEIGCIQHET